MKSLLGSTVALSLERGEWWESQRLGLWAHWELWSQSETASLMSACLNYFSVCSIDQINGELKPGSVYCVFDLLMYFPALLKRILESQSLWQFLKAVRMRRRKIFWQATCHYTPMVKEYLVIIHYFSHLYRVKQTWKKLSTHWLPVRVIGIFDYCLWYFRFTD